MQLHLSPDVMDEVRQAGGLLPEPAVKALFDIAMAAKAHTYSPYSKFPVGAAVLTDSGAVFSGCNVENASYGGAICAERTAIVKAVSEGHVKFVAVGVVTNVPKFTSPCGFCRQFMVEFGKDIQVYLFQQDGSSERHVLRDLLPHSFGPDDLPSL